MDENNKKSGCGSLLEMTGDITQAAAIKTMIQMCDEAMHKER